MSHIALGVLCILGGLAWAELKEWLPWLAKKLVSWSVLLLPSELQSRMGEEWNAELAAIPGKLSPFLYAVSLWWSYRRIGLATARKERTCQPTLRIVDVVCSGSILVFVSPLFAILLLASSISCGSIGLRRTIGIGKKKVPFPLLRFQITHKQSGKVTPFGRFLGSSCLADLPMLINVFRGEMSIVGPSLFKHGRNPVYRPGIVWSRNPKIYVPHDYGVRTVSSLRTYFGLIFSATRAGFLLMLADFRRQR